MARSRWTAWRGARRRTKPSPRARRAPRKSRKVRRRPVTARVRPQLVLLLLGAFLCPSAFGAATIVIQNNDAAGVGFNDTTVVAPVGGNTGTTLGQQRLNAFQAAADKWGSTLTSTVTIVIKAQWTALSCNATSAVLGSAGALEVFRDFSGVPVAGRWYPKALGNKLFGADLDAA